MAAENKIRCRPIGPDDLDGVAGLLARGFPARPRPYWQGGLRRLATREVPDGLPRFGFLLESGGVPVGVILMIAQTITHDGEAFVRCNLASWYVEPAFRNHAAMLSIMPFRNKTATYLNISAAPNTWPTIEAQGFKRYTWGQRMAFPILSRGDRRLRIVPYAADLAPTLPEATLMADHAATGCVTLLGLAPDGPVPIVLLPYRFKQGRFWFPGMQVVYCRSITDIVRFAAPLGRMLLRQGRPFLFFDAPESGRDLPGLFLRGRARKYARGPHPPHLGDLAYTEFTIFGP